MYRCLYESRNKQGSNYLEMQKDFLALLYSIHDGKIHDSQALCLHMATTTSERRFKITEAAPSADVSFFKSALAIINPPSYQDFRHELMAEVQSAGFDFGLLQRAVKLFISYFKQYANLPNTFERRLLDNHQDVIASLFPEREYSRTLEKK
jgi:hypothetical protein